MPALWLASLRQKSQSRSYGGTKESVIQNAIPAAARQAKTKPARHSAKRRLPMSTPTTSLLTMLVATAIKVARAALCADMPVSFVIETGDGVDVSKTGNGRTQDHARRTDALTDNARSYNDEPEKYREGNHRPKSEWIAECRRRRRFRASRLSPERQKDGHTRHQSRNEERRSDQPQERRLQRCDDDDHA